MSSRAKQRDRQRRKRQEKRVALQRAQSGSVYRRIGSTQEVIACYLNRNWREQGVAVCYVLKPAPAGGMALASFLVDIWCMGLKDAYGNLDLSMEDFRAHLERRPDGLDLVRVELDQVRRLVAGGIRFARQNGFKLPAKYERWTAVLGALPEPDLSDFGYQGKLCYVGSIEQLRDRLIGCTVDQFLNREDVEFILPALPADQRPESAPIDQELAEFASTITEIRDEMLDDVRDWLIGEGMVPHPRLKDTIDLSLATLISVYARDEQYASHEEVSAAAEEAFQRELLTLHPDDVAEISGALAQLSQYQGGLPGLERLSSGVASVGG